MESLVEAAHAKGALVIVSVDPDQPGPAAPAGRLRRRYRGGRRAGAGQPHVVRRPVPGHHGLSRRLPTEDAGSDRGPDHRSARQALLGAHAPDARAAHPPRKSHVQHLHQPGPAGPAVEHLPGRHGPLGPAPGRRALDPQSPLRGRTPCRRARSVARVLADLSSRNSWFEPPGTLRPSSRRSAASATTAASPWVGGIPAWKTPS